MISPPNVCDFSSARLMERFPKSPGFTSAIRLSQNARVRAFGEGQGGTRKVTRGKLFCHVQPMGRRERRVINPGWGDGGGGDTLFRRGN